jgi:hypothetical protein
MPEVLLKLIVRDHQEVINHCRLLLRSPTLRRDERERWKHG